jgi:hypothetical protein
MTYHWSKMVECGGCYDKVEWLDWELPILKSSDVDLDIRESSQVAAGNSCHLSAEFDA